jgi:hypothetical protein
MISKEAAWTASHCRHYAMCKIDFLGTGLCPSGPEYHYVSYYPQGRMDLLSALARDLLPLTPALVDIADTCTLCGICDKQCHFVTGLRPTMAMKALKAHVEGWLKEGQAVEPVRTDAVIERIRDIVGEAWAANDPAILFTYADDPFPLKAMQMPAYVALPSNQEELVKIIEFANEYGIAFTVRGNGASVFGLVFSDGLVIDLNRMKSVTIDKENWVAIAEAGATAFEVQSAAYKHGFRVNAAEPAATICGNIFCTGLFSTWSNAYGVGADNLVNAELVDHRGKGFTLADPLAPNLFAFKNQALSPPAAICTKAYIKMYPITGDEEGLLVPFHNMEEAIAFARELGQRRIGLALAVLGDHYLSTFMAPTIDLIDRVKTGLTAALGIEAVVFMVGDRYAREAVRSMVPIVMDNRLMRILMLGLPNFAAEGWTELLQGFEGNRFPYELVLREEMIPLLETVLDPSPETLASAVDEDLRDFYSRLYERSEMTDPVWLNMFRIVSSRMARRKHVVAFILYTPLEEVGLITRINALFKEVGDRHGLENAYGFLTPIDFGKRAVLEYDYYLDQNDKADQERIAKAMVELEPVLEKLKADIPGLTTLPYILNQGCARKEHYLYA